MIIYDQHKLLYEFNNLKYVNYLNAGTSHSFGSIIPFLKFRMSLRAVMEIS
jgi:hypothetical protein